MRSGAGVPPGPAPSAALGHTGAGRPLCLAERCGLTGTTSYMGFLFKQKDKDLCRVRFLCPADRAPRPRQLAHLCLPGRLISIFIFVPSPPRPPRCGHVRRARPAPCGPPNLLLDVSPLHPMTIKVLVSEPSCLCLVLCHAHPGTVAPKRELPLWPARDPCSIGTAWGAAVWVHSWSSPGWQAPGGR